MSSGALHALAFLSVWWTQSLEAEPVLFEAIHIELVSPPPAPVEEIVEETAPPEEELVVETPETPDPEPEPETEIPPPLTEVDPPEEQPEPTPDRTEPDEPREESDVPPPQTEDVPEELPEETGEGINVRLEGIRRDYPEYYNNIIRQIRRCFRPTGGAQGRATVRFYIDRSGTVSDLSVVERSGDPVFDIEAMGAVECAGQQGRLGALPEDLPFDRLPVEFSFEPRSEENEPDEAPSTF